MRSFAACLLAALASIAPPAPGDTVYRCIVNGKTVYAATPAGGQCETQEIRVEQPDPAAVERQRQKLEEWNLRREEQVQRSLDRESAAGIQRQQAEWRALGPARNPYQGRREGNRGRRSRGGHRSGGAPADAAAPVGVDRVGVSGR